MLIVRDVVLVLVGPLLVLKAQVLVDMWQVLYFYFVIFQ